MNPAEYLGKTFACECGKTHAVHVREIVYADDAIARLPACLSQSASGRRLNLVADKRTFAVAGGECAAVLKHAGWTVRTVIVPDGPQGDPVCDDLTRDALIPKLPPADLLLAVGSGVINDLVKWISATGGTPYAVVATAASMNGYTSNNIAPTIRGVKRLIDGTVPRAVLAVPAIIRDAPFELTAAGLGDVLAKPVSMTDWKLNQLLFEEYYCPLCVQLIRELEPRYMNRPEAIRAREPEALQALCLALIYSGLSMTMAGTSFPASGGEHLVSHALDVTAPLHGIRHDYHGRQVGLGTIFACALYERVLALEAPVFRFVSEPTDSAYWRELTPVVEEEHAPKRRKAERAVGRLNQPGAWNRIRATLKPSIRAAAEIKRCLREAGAAHRVADIGCDRERFLAAALHCHQMRERYTIIDLARAAGVLPGAAPEIIEEYLV